MGRTRPVLPRRVDGRAVTLRRRGLLAATLSLVFVGCAVLLGCAAQPSEAEPEARPVTTEESQQLAITRFNNFDAGSRPFSTSVQERGVELQLQGWVDYASHLGYAATTGSFAAQALIWTPTEIGIKDQQPGADGNPVLPMPGLDDPALSLDNLDPASSRLDTLLAIISSLGADRPDNPLLLQQSGALWLRADRVDDVPVTVFAAPPSDEPRDASSPPLDENTSPLRLWVTADGVLLRAEALLGDAWSTIDFSSQPGLELTLPDEGGQ